MRRDQRRGLIRDLLRGYFHVLRDRTNGGYKSGTRISVSYHGVDVSVLNLDDLPPPWCALSEE